MWVGYERAGEVRVACDLDLDNSACRPQNFSAAPNNSQWNESELGESGVWGGAFWVLGADLAVTSLMSSMGVGVGSHFNAG